MRSPKGFALTILLATVAGSGLSCSQSSDPAEPRVELVPGGEVGLPVEPGTSITFGMAALINHGPGDITIVDVEPTGVDGQLSVDQVEVGLLTEPSSDVVIPLIARGFPPPNFVPTVPAVGATIPVASALEGAENPYPVAVFLIVARADELGESGWDGVRISYSVGDDEVIEQWGEYVLQVCVVEDPGPDSCSEPAG